MAANADANNLLPDLNPNPNPNASESLEEMLASLGPIQSVVQKPAVLKPAVQKQDVQGPGAPAPKQEVRGNVNKSGAVVVAPAVVAAAPVAAPVAAPAVPVVAQTADNNRVSLVDAAIEFLAKREQKAMLEEARLQEIQRIQRELVNKNAELSGWMDLKSGAEDDVVASKSKLNGKPTAADIKKLKADAEALQLVIANIQSLTADIEDLTTQLQAMGEEFEKTAGAGAGAASPHRERTVLDNVDNHAPKSAILSDFAAREEKIIREQAEVIKTLQALQGQLLSLKKTMEPQEQALAEASQQAMMTNDQTHMIELLTELEPFQREQSGFERNIVTLMKTLLAAGLSGGTVWRIRNEVRLDVKPMPVAQVSNVPVQVAGAAAVKVAEPLVGPAAVNGSAVEDPALIIGRISDLNPDVRSAALGDKPESKREREIKQDEDLLQAENDNKPKETMIQNREEADLYRQIDDLNARTPQAVRKELAGKRRHDKPAQPAPAAVVGFEPENMDGEAPLLPRHPMHAAAPAPAPAFNIPGVPAYGLPEGFWDPVVPVPSANHVQKPANGKNVSVGHGAGVGAGAGANVVLEHRLQRREAPKQAAAASKPQVSAAVTAVGAAAERRRLALEKLEQQIKAAEALTAQYKNLAKVPDQEVKIAEEGAAAASLEGQVIDPQRAVKAQELYEATRRTLSLGENRNGVPGKSVPTVGAGFTPLADARQMRPASAGRQDRSMEQYVARHAAMRAAANKGS